jgi:Subtilase family
VPGSCLIILEVIRNVPLISRVLGRTPSAALVCCLAGLIALSGTPVQAAALSKPRSEQWWFAFWDIQHRVWQHTRGHGITVAVLDTGVNANLPELRNVVLRGGDGRHGYHTDGRTDLGPGPGHGTEMAALIASQGGGTGLVGVAPDAKILPVVVDGMLTSLLEAIHYAADHGAQVINVSQGYPYPGGCPDVVEDAVSYAIDKGAVIVAGAGNDGDTTNPAFLPASCPGVLAVGAITNQKLAWVRTERQSYVSVAAPGVEVGSVTKRGTFNNTISGTSQSSALTAAAVALLRAASPQLSPRQVVQRIINTTVDAGPPGPDNMTGSGAVVPILALTRDVATSAPNPTFDRLDRWLAANSAPAKGPGGTASPDAVGKPDRTGKPHRVEGVAVAAAGRVAVLAVVAAAVIGLLVARRRRPGPRSRS